MELVLLLANLTAATVSAVAAVAVLRAVRRISLSGTETSTKDKRGPGTDLLLRKDSRRILGQETPTDAAGFPRIRRSPLAAAEDRRAYFSNDR